MPAKNHSAASRRHEAQNPPAGWVTLAAAAVPLMVAACLVAVWLILASWTKTRPLDSTVRVRGSIVATGTEPLTRFPKPNLEVNPQADLTAVRSKEHADLESYEWVDRKAGLVRIPIDRAIDLLAQRGLPFRASNAPIAIGPSEFELSRSRSDNRKP